MGAAPLVDACSAAPTTRRDHISTPNRASRSACDSLQFAAGGVGSAERNSPALVRAVLDDACRAAQRVSFERVLNHGRARANGIELGALAAGIGFAFLLMPQIMPTWFQRNWLLREIPWPQDTYITPVGYDGEGKRRVPEGDELEVVAQIRGEVPDRVAIDGGRRRAVAAMRL